MGMFFTNVHIKKNDKFDMQKLNEVIAAEFGKQGFEPAETGFISAAVYAPADSDWVTVASSLLCISDPTGKISPAEPFSAAFDTDVLAFTCVDSDFLFIGLVNSREKINACAVVGQVYDMEIPIENDFSAWEKKIKNIDAFKNTVNEDHVFAEEALTIFEDEFDLPYDQAVFSENHFEDPDDVTELYFSGGKDMPFDIGMF